MLLVYVFFLFNAVNSQEDCVKSVDQACQSQQQDIVQKADALLQSTGGILSDTKLTEEATNQQAGEYCRFASAYVSCIETAANYIQCSNAKDFLLRTARQTLAQKMGDPRAYLAAAHADCAAMTSKFYPVTATASEPFDPTADLICAQTCAFKYKPSDAGVDFQIFGLCRQYPDVSICMQRCKASETMFRHCSTEPTSVAGQGDRFTKQSYECGQRCIVAFQSEQSSPEVNVIGLCAKHPEVLECLTNCAVPAAVVAQCHLPQHCATPQDTRSDSPILTACNTIDREMQCVFPISRHQPGALAHIRANLLRMRPEAAAVSVLCEQKFEEAIRLIDSYQQ